MVTFINLLFPNPKIYVYNYKQSKFIIESWLMRHTWLSTLNYTITYQVETSSSINNKTTEKETTTKKIKTNTLPMENFIIVDTMNSHSDRQLQVSGQPSFVSYQECNLLRPNNLQWESTEHWSLSHLCTNKKCVLLHTEWTFWTFIIMDNYTGLRGYAVMILCPLYEARRLL